MSRNSFLTDILSTLFERRPRSARLLDDRSIEALCESLLSSQGEISGHKLAESVLKRFDGLNDEETAEFFRFLSEKLDIDTDVIARMNEAYAADPTAVNLDRLIQAVEPPRQELLRRINQVPDATAQLVSMRKKLLGMLREHPEFRRTDLDFQHLFSSWFNRGFLVMRRIRWDTPASILEKIIKYEAVHAINDWDDLRRRVQPEDRRCYAFFHPAMPDDPLIFVEVALAKGIPDSIQAILADDRNILTDAEADTAVFYSISNCQAGLRGVSFGNFLIKQVVEDLRKEIPGLKTFVTLSPIPGFVPWLKDTLDEGSPIADLVARLDEIDTEGLNALVSENAALIKGLAADYLYNAKHRTGQPLDPVARFHLHNGAVLHDLHALADVSRNGLTQSLGTMVNYLYDLDKVEENHEAYASEHTLAVSKPFKSILGSASPQSENRKVVNG